MFRRLLLCPMVASLAMEGCSVFEEPRALAAREGGGGTAPVVSEAGPVSSSSDASNVRPKADAAGTGGGLTTRDARADAPRVRDGGGGGGGDGGGTRGKPWWPRKNALGCDSAGLPTAADRPLIEDEGAEQPAIYMALQFLRWGTMDDLPSLALNDDAWQDVGFDLDGLCTRSSTCKDGDGQLVQQSACRHSTQFVPIDGRECRDNTLGNLYVLGSKTSASNYFGLTENDTNCEIWRGGASVVFKVSGYNGEANDPHVRLDLYPSVGLFSQPNWRCRTRIEEPLQPGWQNQAPWVLSSRFQILRESVDPSASTDGDGVPNSKVADAAAYVRDGYLVARLPEAAELPLAAQNTPIASFKFVMHRPTIALRLFRKQTTEWAFDGTIQFVVTPQDLIASYRAMGFCENLCGTYAQTRDYFYLSADSLLTDDIAPDTPCEAISAAIQLRGKQMTASKRDLVDTPPPPPLTANGCPDPANSKVPRQGCVCDRNNNLCISGDGGS